MYQKLWSDDVHWCTVDLKYGAQRLDRQTDRQADGWMDGWKDKKSDIQRWHTEVGAPPNNLGIQKTACLKGFISALGLW